jgi:IclR family pca regulon transcriptional regulator
VAVYKASAATTNGVSMNDQLRNSFTSLAPPIVASPAKRIQALTGDPDFMTSLARGLAVIQAFQERKRHLTIAQISHRTEIPRAAVRRCLHTLIKLGYATTDGRTYSLLPKVLTLGHAYLSSTPLAVSSQPYLDRMSDSCTRPATWPRWKATTFFTSRARPRLSD